MAKEPVQNNQPRPDDGDEELLKVMAGGAVDRLLLEQEAELTGAAPALDEGAAVEPPADPTDQTLTPEELEALFGPPVEPPVATGEPADTAPAPVNETPEATAAPETTPAEPDAGDGTLTQADLDALFDEKPQAPAAAAPPQTQAPDAAPTTDGTLSQADLDALFDSGGDAAPVDEAPSPQAAAPAAGEGEAKADTGETLTQADLDVLFGPDADLEAEIDETDEPLTQDDLDALFADDGEADEPTAEGSPEGEPAGNETLSQNDLDALFAEAEADVAQAPPDEAEASSEEDQAEALSQNDLDALFAEPGDGDSADKPKPTLEQLDTMLSQAADENPPAEADAGLPIDNADDLEAALNRQQADFPDVDNPVDADESVSGAEQQALRAAAAPPSLSEPVMSMADLDKLLAGRAEAAKNPEAAAQVAVPITAAEPAATPAPQTAATAEAPAKTAAEASAAKGPDLDIPLPMRVVFRVLDRLDEPFADLAPATKAALGYAGFALLGAAACVMIAVALR